MEYKKGYRYQLHKDELFILNHIYTFREIETDYIILHQDRLILKKGYAWNGANKPAINTKNSIRGSALHDAIYQLIRLELLPKSYRYSGDKEIQDVLLEDKMSRFRAWWWFRAVRVGGESSADPKNKRKVLIAP